MHSRECLPSIRDEVTTSALPGRIKLRQDGSHEDVGAAKEHDVLSLVSVDEAFGGNRSIGEEPDVEALAEPMPRERLGTC
jgi:hypothetical protein